MKHCLITIAIGLLIGCSLAAEPPIASESPPEQSAANASPTIPKKQETEVALELGDGVKLELLLVHPGVFVMGDDRDRDAKPARKVTIAKPFYLGKYEVTQEQWKAVMGTVSRSTLKGDRLPVESVHWTECLEFCTKLSARSTRKGFRLPTTAEWEYACRAGTTTKYCSGDDFGKLSEYAWWSGSLPSGGPKGVSSVQPVGG